MKWGTQPDPVPQKKATQNQPPKKNDFVFDFLEKKEETPEPVEEVSKFARPKPGPAKKPEAEPLSLEEIMR